MRAPRRRCKAPGCGAWFNLTYSNVYWCCEEHKTQYLAHQREKQKTKAKDRLKNKPVHHIRPRKETKKTKSQWREEAQNAFNRYVRLRDAGKPCISCGCTPGEEFGGSMDCGHYRTRGAASHLSFNLHNTAAQCVHCNRDRAGARKAFEQGLIERIGREKVEALNSNNESRIFDIPYFRRVKSIFTRKSHALEKRRFTQQEYAA
ncbi:Protein NinG [Klebsiella michiganensis]|uniref:recombination protein NinG n=1 Tax=Klebsiella michiganensis TaxID=1134687 RepID=UPI003B233569